MTRSTPARPSGRVKGMTELKPIVTEHVLAAELPEHLRPGLDATTRVRVTVEPEPDPKKLRPITELFGAAKTGLDTTQKVVDHVRALRDEWN